VVGECKLCLENKNLARSHFNPAAVYKIFDSPHSPNRNPVLVTSNVVVQTSKQITDYTFCDDCEDVFDEGGERWFLPLLPKNRNTFPLFELVNGVPPDCVEGDSRCFAASRNPSICVKDLAHFALGLFWRGTLRWKSSEYEPINLGPYAGEIASFLLGKTAFPKDVVLSVTVIPPPLRVMLSYMPFEGVKDGMVHNFSLYLPGVHFLLSVGKEMVAESRDLCFYANPLHPINVSDVSDMVERIPKAQYYRSKEKMAKRAAAKRRWS